MNSSSLQLLGLPMLAWVPLLPLLGATFNLIFGRRLSKGTIHTIAVGSVGLAFVLSAYLVFGPLWAEYKAGRGGIGLEQTVYNWIEVGNFKVQLAFRLDTLSAVMILIVTFIGSLIHVYSTGYMHEDKSYARYFAYLNLFLFFMLMLVLGRSLLVLFVAVAVWPMAKSFMEQRKSRSAVAAVQKEKENA